ncbi:MAG: hypothetical protein Ct9H90mP5_01020 [Acidimicrobiaceae bacterium]|nr:MAG: hypothetical protein Ct9H90mP5_01020 [Acidimicrobiaceae bacterium]
MGDGSISVNPTPEPYWFGQYVGGFNPNTARNDYWKFSLFLIITAALLGLLLQIYVGANRKTLSCN